MEILTKQMDECNISEEKSIKNELTKCGENFIASFGVFKFNDYKKR